MNHCDLHTALWKPGQPLSARWSQLCVGRPCRSTPWLVTNCVVLFWGLGLDTSVVGQNVTWCYCNCICSAAIQHNGSKSTCIARNHESISLPMPSTKLSQLYVTWPVISSGADEMSNMLGNMLGMPRFTGDLSQPMNTLINHANPLSYTVVRYSVFAWSTGQNFPHDWGSVPAYFVSNTVNGCEWRNYS